LIAHHQRCEEPSIPRERDDVLKDNTVLTLRPASCWSKVISAAFAFPERPKFQEGSNTKDEASLPEGD
jgi:hypothetical protein